MIINKSERRQLSAVKPLYSILRFDCDAFPKLANSLYQTAEEKARMCIPGEYLGAHENFGQEVLGDLLILGSVLLLGFFTSRTLPTTSIPFPSDGSPQEGDYDQDDEGDRIRFVRPIRSDEEDKRRSSSSSSTRLSNLCPQCQGKKQFMGMPCDLCDGKGYIDFEDRSFLLPKKSGEKRRLQSLDEEDEEEGYDLRDEDMGGSNSQDNSNGNNTGRGDRKDSKKDGNGKGKGKKDSSFFDETDEM